MPLLAPSKTITIMGREYTERRWKKALRSNKGIFKRIDLIPMRIVGPTPYEKKGTPMSGEVLGYGGGTEIFQALQYCTPKQQEVHKKLENEDFEKSVEYAFTISNLDVVWKEKIKVLQNIIIEIESEERAILDEEAIVEKAKRMRESLDPKFESRFPADFAVISADIENLENFKQDLEKAKAHLEAVVAKLKSHLERIKRQYPFLF